MSFKEIIGLSLITLVLFPILMLGILLGTGTVHLEVGNANERERLREAFKMSESSKQDSAEASQLKSFKALVEKEKESEGNEAAVRREIERLENLKMETIREKEEILKQRHKIEELVAHSGDLQDKQIASLAEVYASMRPDEAAPILLSLKDPLIVQILKKIPDARAAAKLMASLGTMDVARTARITEMMGKAPLVSTEPSPPGPAKPVPEAKKSDSTPSPTPAAPASGKPANKA